MIDGCSIATASRWSRHRLCDLLLRVQRLRDSAQRRRDGSDVNTRALHSSRHRQRLAVHAKGLAAVAAQRHDGCEVAQRL
jgi:hypothetical protein